MRFIYLLSFFLSLAFCLNCPAGNLSETGTSKIINISIDESAIPCDLISNLTCRLGQKCSYQQINRDIHQLMKLGIFKNVIVTVKTITNDVTVSYSFIGRPVISAWTNKIYSCSLKPPKEISESEVGNYFNVADWFNDKKKIKEFYRANNYNNITLSSRVENVNGENKVILYTDVFPGKKQFVESIKIIGCADYEKSEIESSLHFEPRNLWLFKRGNFSPEKFTKDKNKILDYLINSGFLDAEVDFSVTDNQTSKLVDINILICKGPQYKLGTLIWNQQFLSSNDFAQLKNELTFPENSPYTPDIIDVIRQKTDNFCVKVTPHQPYLTIMPIVSEIGEPTSPVIDIIISLRKGRIGYRNSKFISSSFSYPASLAHEYLNK